MIIKNYDELTAMEIDTLREVGSIGTGNAATALSSMLNREIRITYPEVRIMGYNEAIEWIGGPEVITAGVLVCAAAGFCKPCARHNVAGEVRAIYRPWRYGGLCAD